jgi:valyl-tRNA synthetase
MSISKTYSPKEVEDKWYQYWLENKFFKSTPNPDKEPYTIVIPSAKRNRGIAYGPYAQ